MIGRAESTLALSLVVALAGFGGFAWLTHHPDAAIVERARAWPLVGPLAARFHDAYAAPPPLSPPPGAASARSPSPSKVAPAATRTASTWKPAPPPRDPARAGAPRRVWVRDGAVLRTARDEGAAALHVVDGFYTLPRLERRGDWFRVWHGGREAWVLLPGYRADGETGPPFGDAPRPPGPLPGRRPDARKLEVTLAHLDARQRRHDELGPYTVHTDLPRTEDAKTLLRRLSRIAAQVEPLYTARYGVTPIDRPRAEVILFADAAGYEAARDAVRETAGLPSTGHAAFGVVVLYAAEDRADTVSTLVHEITHLLNRRALGPALPPWLDEGLADALAGSAVDLDGVLQPRRLGGRRLELPDRIVFTGARASLWSLRRSLAGDPGRLQRVLGLDRDGFLGGDVRAHYDVAAAWVRFVLEADDGRHADGFRAFLAAVAAGGDPSAGALVERLQIAEDAWPAVEASFRRWVVLRTAAFDA